VQDSGVGIPVEWQEQVFEPFGAAERRDHHYKGIGLGLSITRRLVALHGGSMALDSRPGEGSTFHVLLPLPSLDDRPASPAPDARPVLLLVSGREQVADEIVALAQRRGLEIRRLQPGESVEGVLAEAHPSALAWDLAGSDPGDRPGEWMIVQQLRAHPRLRRAPFVLYAQEAAGEKTGLAAGLTNVVLKPASGATLSGAIDALRPPGAAGSVLVVDDDEEARERYSAVVAEALPGYPVRTAGDGAEALALMGEETPCLVILDLMMPEVDGFEVLDAMRADPRTRRVPVLVLSGRALTFDDVERLERHALVTFQSKGVLSADETAAALHRTLFGSERLPPRTGALVKRTIAYFHQHYDQPLTREEVASAVGASESYVTHVFRQELGLSPWDYLNRYRVGRARELLHATNDTITSIAHRVGFGDLSYFGRVFRKMTGLSPTEYRKRAA
jgi:AraC-like DNA-binding protein